MQTKLPLGVNGSAAVSEVTELCFLRRGTNVDDGTGESKVSLTQGLAFHLGDLLLCKSQYGNG